MGSASTDTEGRLYYAILYKGFEHLQILVTTGPGEVGVGVLEAIPPRILRDDCIFFFFFN